MSSEAKFINKKRDKLIKNEEDDFKIECYEESNQIIDYDNYDFIRSENQNKLINELKLEIDEFKRRERAFITHLHIKEKEIYYLESNLRQANISLREKNNIDYFIDHMTYNELNKLKNLIKERDEKLLQKEEELGTYQLSNNPNFKKLVIKCRDFHKENSDFSNFCQNGILENLKYENGIKETQIDQLMLKLKEKEAVISEQENELSELAETSCLLNKKIRDLEEEILNMKKNNK